MYHLFMKNELSFSVAWIISYVVLFSAADSCSALLEIEKVLTAPVAVVFALLLLAFRSKRKIRSVFL